MYRLHVLLLPTIEAMHLGDFHLFGNEMLLQFGAEVSISLGGGAGWRKDIGQQFVMLSRQGSNQQGLLLGFSSDIVGDEVLV